MCVWVLQNGVAAAGMADAHERNQSDIAEGGEDHLEKAPHHTDSPVGVPSQTSLLQARYSQQNSDAWPAPSDT